MCVCLPLIFEKECGCPSNRQSKAHAYHYGVQRSNTCSSVLQCNMSAVDVLDPGAPLPPRVCQALFKARREPLVIKGQLNSWTKSRFWTPNNICRHLGSKTTAFKISPKRDSPIFQKRFSEKEVVYETQCDYVETTFNNFLEWLDCSSSTPSKDDGGSEIKTPLCKRVKLDPSQSGESSTGDKASHPSQTTSIDSSSELPSRETHNPLMDYSKTNYWIYADYEYMVHLCKDLPDMLSSVDWSVIGFDARDGKDSTLWIGSEGAHTPCHFDTYGCNFVAQLFGKKKWILFDPQDSDKLYPTRVPYEESSVFCRVNITNPDIIKYPLFNEATAYEVSCILLLTRFHFVCTFVLYICIACHNIRTIVC